MAESVRLQKNQDLLERGVWIRHPDTHLVHLVMHKAHVKRLLDEGGVQVAGPENHTPIAVEAQAATIAELQDELARLRAQLAQSEDGKHEEAKQHASKSSHGGLK